MEMEPLDAAQPSLEPAVARHSRRKGACMVYQVRGPIVSSQPTSFQHPGCVAICIRPIHTNPRYVADYSYEKKKQGHVYACDSPTHAYAIVPHSTSANTGPALPSSNHPAPYILVETGASSIQYKRTGPSPVCELLDVRRLGCGLQTKFLNNIFTFPYTSPT